MVGDSPPVNVRGVGESCKIVKQTDSGFGVDAQADPGGPSSPDSPLHIRPLRMTFVMGGNSQLAPSIRSIPQWLTRRQHCCSYSSMLLSTPTLDTFHFLLVIPSLQATLQFSYRQFTYVTKEKNNWRRARINFI